MDLCGHFEYDGILSRKYGLVFANVEVDRFTALSGTVQHKSFFNKSSGKRYHMEDDLSDSPFSFDVEIITDDESVINTVNRREIERWLFDKNNYCRLYLDPEDDEFNDSIELVNGEQKRLYLNCKFFNPKKIEYNGGVVGYQCTLEADSGYWHQDAIVQTFVLNNDTPQNDMTFTINIDTDLTEYIYPNIKFTTSSKTSSDVSITNLTDSRDRVTQFRQLDTGVEVYLDGEIRALTTSSNEIDSYNDLWSSRNFPRLLNGENEIQVRGSVASITFEWSARRRF